MSITIPVWLLWTLGISLGAAALMIVGAIVALIWVNAAFGGSIAKGLGW